MPSWKKVIVSGSDASLNSLYAPSITGSLQGTASYALNGGVTQLFAGPNITLAPTTGVGQVTISSAGAGTYYNTSTGSYGSFYDTTTQTNPVANVPRSMSLNTTDITNGVSVSGSSSPFNTYLKIENAGVYNIQFSAQLIKTDSGTDFVDIWLRRNGVDLMDSATNVTLIGNNDRQVAAWNWFATAGAGDYYQIMWASADTNVQLLAEPATGVHPGIPSVIVTANRIDTFLSNTGSFSGSFNGVLNGTASYATQAATASYASYVEYTNVANKPTLISSSAQIATDISGAFASTSASLDAKINNVIATTVTTASFNSFTGSYTTASFTGSFTGNGSGLIGVVTSSYAISSSYALNALTSSYSLNSQLLNGSDSAVFATTGSNIFKASQTITGSLTITNDLVVLGSSSIQYITSSQLDISTNIISVNTINPGVRFGGIAVIDSGSSPQTSGSLLFDSQNNQWIFVHQDGGSATTSSVLIMGPQTFNNVGNEATITTNRLTKGTGGDLGEHIGDSNITDTGTTVSINSNTEITGSVKITNSLTVGGTIIGNGGMSMSGSNSVTGSLVITGSTSTDLVRITQTGTGNAFVVEDSVNPDATPFAISSAGNVGIGVSPTPAFALYINSTNNYGISSQGGLFGISAVGSTAGVQGSSNGGAGVYGLGYDAATMIGVEGYTDYSDGTGVLSIGGKFTARLSTNNYSVQLIDGTETVAGRFLINQTTDGKANWGNSIPDIQITGAITGSTGNNTSTDAMIQSALLYLSNNC